MKNEKTQKEDDVKVSGWRYIAAWFLMPVLAIRHKLKRIDHYQVNTDKLGMQKIHDYIRANNAFEVLLKTQHYGERIEFIEVKKNGKTKIIRSLKW